MRFVHQQTDYNEQPWVLKQLCLKEKYERTVMTVNLELSMDYLEGGVNLVFRILLWNGNTVN